jgi:multidrug efflux pump subunit AcrA (membrane-fusion protein)
MEAQMWSPKKKWILIFLGILLILVLLAFLIFRRQTLQERSLSAPIKRGNVIESVYGIGLVKTSKIYDLKPGVVNSVEQIFVKEGDEVKKGDRLVLSGDGPIVKAPFDGTVVWIPVNVRENIFPQMVVVRVVDLKSRYMVATLEQRAAIKVKNGQKARVSFDGFRDETFDGVVEGIYSNENNFNVRIRVNQMPDQILPGMTGDVAIGIQEHHDVLVVPVAAIQNGSVEVQRKGWKKSIPVKTGIVDADVAEIISGELHEGDRLILPKGKTP